MLEMSDGIWTVVFIHWNWPTPKINSLRGTFHRTTYPAHWDSKRAKPAHRGSPQNLDATLTVSTVEARVKVTGECVAPLDLNDAQIGNMVTSQQISSLPLVLRDPYQLALLSPGVNQSNSILGGLSVNGSGERNNNFLLDGTDNNDNSGIPGSQLVRF